MKIGICFGGYCPLHRGHLDVIMRAKKECDKVLLIVCGYDGEPRGQEIGCDLDERLYKIKFLFSGDEIIRVEKINDTELGLDESMCQKNWEIWTKEAERLILENFGLNPTPPTYYVSEPFYRERLEGLGKDVVLMEKETPISGTLIRRDPIKYWDYIAYPFKELFSQGILITGTSSEGKTTLCEDICSYFFIQGFPEYGRRYMEETGIRDDQLDLEDFKNFIRFQHSNPISDKVWISDTDNLVTLMYAKAYSERPEMKITPEEYEELKKLVKPRKWKKIFMLPPMNPNFIDDGIRYMPQATMEERLKNYEILKDLMKEYGYEYEELRGNYYQNFLTVKNYIQTL